MNSCSKLTAFALLVLITLSTTTACEEYEPPPEIDLIRSGGGAYDPGSALTLRLSSTIDPATFEMKIWPTSRGTRRVAEDDSEPLVGPCTISSDECQGVTVELNEDAESITISLDEPYSGMGSNFVLEVLPGLTDRAGNATGVSRFFTVRYRGATDPDPDANIAFDEGIFIFGGSVNNPIPAVMTLVSNVRVLSDGRLAVAGARGIVADSEPDTSRDPRFIEVDDGNDGWSLFFTGLIVETDDDRLFLETEVFDVSIPALGSFLHLEEVRLFAEIIKDEDGYDFIDGTLTYEKLILGQDEYDGDSTSLIGEYVPTEHIPDGAPEICDNPCGAIVGQCEVPAGFPDPDFCVDDEE